MSKMSAAQYSHYFHDIQYFQYLLWFLYLSFYSNNHPKTSHACVYYFREDSSACALKNHCSSSFPKRKMCRNCHQIYWLCGSSQPNGLECSCHTSHWCRAPDWLVRVWTRYWRLRMVDYCCYHPCILVGDPLVPCRWKTYPHFDPWSYSPKFYGSVA